MVATARDDSAHVASHEVEWLAEQLDRHRVGQAELARQLEIDPSAISRALNGRRRLKRSDFTAMVAELESVAGLPVEGWQRQAWDARMTLAALSAASGVGLPRLSAILRGRGEPLTSGEISALAAATGYVNGKDDAGSPAPALVRKTWSFSSMDGGIPVLEAPEARDDGLLEIRDLVAEVRRPAPVQLQGVEGAYGIFLDNGMLVPRWYPGEVLFLHPGKPLVAGRWFAARLIGGGSVVGLATAVDETAIEVDGLAPRRSFRLDRAEVVSAAVVVGSWCE